MKKTIFITTGSIFVAVFIFLSYFSFSAPRVKFFLQNYLPPQTIFGIQSLVRGQIGENALYTYRSSNLDKAMLTNFEVTEINLIDYIPANTKTRYNSFFIEEWNDKLIIVSHDGYITDVDNKLSKATLRQEKLDVVKILDVLIIGDRIYISAGINDENGCARHKVLSANLLQENLEFKILFSTPDCGGRDASDLYAGRMHKHILNNEVGLLLSTSNHIGNQPTMDAQKNKSSFGKILFVPFSENKPMVFSKGHRNVQGIEVVNGTILATEHGPEGGDELNDIEFNGNYGWPIASYGGRYDPKTFAMGNSSFPRDFTFKSDHKALGFKNSVFSWLQSIGVSQLVKLPQDTIPGCFNCVIVSSLNGRAIFIVNFADGYERVIYLEKVLVGERIRDIHYDKSENSLYLALEESATLKKLKFEHKER